MNNNQQHGNTAKPRKQRLELTWIGKDEELKLEPRILVEDPEKSYGDPNSENMLIYGDNLLALKALEQDYAGKVKCIYIDPPYNTGKAFDKYDDGLEHSIWLSLITPRIELLKRLLTDDGVLWISLDDSEVHYMKVLCDEIFGRNNFLGSLPTVMNLKGNNDEFGFAGTHEYTLVYANNKAKAKLYEFDIDEEEMNEKWEEDDIGYYKKGAPLRATGEESTREHRPKMFYPILFDEKLNKVFTIKEDEFKKIYNKETKTFDDLYLEKLKDTYGKDGVNFILPMVDDNTCGRWRWGYNNGTIGKLNTDVLINKTKNGYTLNKKQRPEIGELPSKKPKSLFYKPEYSSGNGTAQLKKIFNRAISDFPYPKPEDLIHDFIILSTKEDDLVLDSFLGSGTTAAVAHKLNRKWIGIEMGEHAHTLCQPRLKMVVDGSEDVGITKKVGWQGGGGFKFYNLAPSLLRKDKYGNWIIDEKYNANMLAAAMCKHEGFRFKPHEELYWKQGQSTETDYVFITTAFVTVEQLDKIHEEMGENESLLICAKSFAPECENRHPNITVKKIPLMILGKCEFGQENYDLNIIQATEEVAENQDTNHEDYE